MISVFREHIENAFPLLLTSKVLIAVSGGLDSTVLATLCKEAGVDFAIAHCNFKLRGQESDADEFFVKNLAKDLGVMVHIQHFDTLQRVAQVNESVQMAAREIRYKWFNELCDEFGYSCILTAHHFDDSVETFFINLLRGCGLEGLTGIPETRNNIIRPLLNFKRKDLKEYALSKNIKWREDSSNKETKYLRNKIRHKLIPVLKEINHEFSGRFKYSQNHLRGSQAIIENHINTLKKKYFTIRENETVIAVKTLQELKPLDAYLYELFREFNVTSIKDLKNILASQSGKQLLTPTHRIIKDREVLLVRTLENLEMDKEVYYWSFNEPVLLKPIHLSCKTTELSSNAGTHKIYVDKEKLKFPLQLRKWKNGDYFYPAGMHGSKKLSKYFKDEKYSLFEKEAQWLLCSEDDIVWIIGKRADRRFLAGPESKNILEICYIL